MQNNLSQPDLVQNNQSEAVLVKNNLSEAVLVQNNLSEAVLVQNDLSEAALVQNSHFEAEQELRRIEEQNPSQEQEHRRSARHKTLLTQAPPDPGTILSLSAS